MGFFDLNIPYNESDRHIAAANKAKLKAHRLKLVIKIAELGYTGVAYNRVIKGVMSESDRCSISLFPLSSLLKIAPTLSNSVKFHRELLKVPVSTPFRQYTRLTVVIESPAQAAALNSGNPILKSYDIVAVRPMNQNSFEQACQTSEVDVIAIDFTERLPFRLKQPMVKAAIERGVYFEISYSGLIMDAQVRRQMISNAKLLVEWTNGKNLIVSSAAPSASEIRGPYDVANLLSLFGFKSERAKASVSKNCSYVIAKSLRKKHYFKEAIKVDLLPSGGQSNTNEAPVDDWLNWDPTLKCKLNSTISDDSDSVKVTVFDKVAEQLLHKKIPELDSMTPQETSRLLTSTNVRLQNQTFLAQLRAQRKRFDDGITRFTMQQIHFNTTEEGNNSASVKTTPHDNKEPNTAKEARLSATEKEANNNKHTTIKCADRPHQHTMPATPDTPSSPLKKMRPDDS